MSAATHPSTVLAQPGTTARDAIRQRLLLRDRSSCSELVRDALRRSIAPTVVGLRVGEPTVRRHLPGRAEGGHARYGLKAKASG